MSLLVIGPLSTFKIDMPLVNNHTIYGAMLGYSGERANNRGDSTIKEEDEEKN